MVMRVEVSASGWQVVAGDVTLWVCPPGSSTQRDPSAGWEADDGRRGRIERGLTLTAAMRAGLADCPDRSAVELMVSTVFAGSPTLLVEALFEVCGVVTGG